MFILQLFHDMWADMVRSAWLEADEVAVQTVVGGFGSTMVWWLESAPEPSPEEAMSRFRRFIEPALPPRS